MNRFFVFICVIALVLSGCSKGIDNKRLRVDVIEDQPRPFAISSTPLRQGSAYLRMATAQGLVGFDRGGNIIPALAIRWVVTDDGLSYIFRLNKIRWNDNREVAAIDVVAALNARFAELKDSRIGMELREIDRAVPITTKVIELRLKSPMPNLLEILAQPELGLIVKGVGSGPMNARKTGVNMQLNMRQIDQKGKAKLADDQIMLEVNQASRALARFDFGATDLVTGGRFETLPYATATKFNNGAIILDQVPGLFGILIVSNGPFLANMRNREAIAMAIDRPKVVTAFGQSGWQEALSLMPEAMSNRAVLQRPDWTSMRIEERQTKARSQIADWKAGNGDIRRLKIAMPKGPGARILYARLRSDFAKIGLEVERSTEPKDADMIIVDQVASISSPIWYLSQLSCRMTLVCDAQADALVDAARQSVDPTARTQFLHLAEEKLQAHRNFIPIANPIRWSLMRDGIIGFSPNPRGWHPLQELGNGPKLRRE
jgi:ABC-type transport system substrate-binding protein